MDQKNQKSDNTGEMPEVSDQCLNEAQAGSFGSVVSDLAEIVLDIAVPATIPARKTERDLTRAQTGQLGFGDEMKWALLPQTMEEKTEKGMNNYISEQDKKKDELQEKLNEVYFKKNGN